MITVRDYIRMKIDYASDALLFVVNQQIAINVEQLDQYAHAAITILIVLSAATKAVIDIRNRLRKGGQK